MDTVPLYSKKSFSTLMAEKEESSMGHSRISRQPVMMSKAEIRTDIAPVSRELIIGLIRDPPYAPYFVTVLVECGIIRFIDRDMSKPITGSRAIDEDITPLRMSALNPYPARRERIPSVIRAVSSHGRYP